LAAGIEECVHRVNATALLTMYIQRAVKARMLAAEADSPLGPVSVLLHVENNLQLAQLGMSSHRDNLNVSFSYDTEGMLSLLRCADIQAVVLDAKAASKDGWALVRRIREEFLNLPVLVAVDDLALGSEAVSRGATEYLQMPAKRQDLLTLVHTSRRAEEFEAARDGVGQDESGG
jgi:ActR/RegA family two-component response regulator